MFPDGVVAQIERDVRRFFALVARILRRPERPVAPLPEVVREPIVPATLHVEDVSVRFGGVVAVDDVSLDVRPGEVVGLIGPNGAGKTTLIDVITGFTRPQKGHVSLDDTRADGWSPRRRARAGVARSFQSLELFEDMTVRDNLRTASDRRDPIAYLTDLVWPGNPPLSSTAVAAVREFGLEDDLDRRPGELPVRSAPARRHRPRGRDQARRCCCSTSPPPVSTSTRRPSWAVSSAGSPRSGASRSCSSSTTSRS